jgi:lysophospholipase L1-like esterase
MAKLKKTLSILALNLLLLAAGVAALELIFGGWRDTWRLNRLNLIRDSVRYYDISHLYDDPDPVIQYTRDRHGLRGRHRRPAEIDWLTVGGSTTDQRYIRDGATWQDILEQELARAGAGRVVVANAGVDGQSTYGHILNFDWWFPQVPGLRPRGILFHIGLNDFYKEAGSAYDRLAAGRKRAPRLQERIEANSALVHLYRTLTGAYRALVVERIGHRRVDFTQVPWTPEPLQAEYDFMAPRLAAYAERLRMLVERAEALGARPVLVSQPSRKYKEGPDGILGQAVLAEYDGRAYNGVDFYHMKRKLDDVTAAVAAERGVPYIDLGGPGGWADGDFYDDAHLTPAGARKLGERLAAELLPLLRTTRAPP